MVAEQVHFPRPSDGKTLVAFESASIRYCNVIAVLKNPFYAGAYAYGKGEKRTEIVDGRARTSYCHRKPLEAWDVLLKDHHEPPAARRHRSNPPNSPAAAVLTACKPGRYKYPPIATGRSRIVRMG